MTDRDSCVRGCTALPDAVGGTIHHIGNVHKYVRAEDVPETNHEGLLKLAKEHWSGREHWQLSGGKSVLLIYPASLDFDMILA